MHPILKLALIAGGLWFLFRDQIAAATQNTPAPQTPATTTPAGNEPAPPAAGPTLAEQLRFRAGADAPNGLASSHVWGYYYAQIAGRPAPPPPNGDALISAEQFVANLRMLGVTGLSGLPSTRRAWSL